MLKQVKSAGPLWCGEWGEDNTGNLLDNRLIIKQQPRICGMSFWTWKKVYKKDNRFPLLSIQPNTNWDKVINWITWKIFKPGKEEVKRGIDEFLRAIQADRCHFNTQVKEVVLR
jgi:hypothetical protein